MAKIRYLSWDRYQRSNWPVLVIDLCVGNRRTNNLGWAYASRNSLVHGHCSFPVFVIGLFNEQLRSVGEYCIPLPLDTAQDMVVLLEGPLSYCLRKQSEPKARPGEKLGAEAEEDYRWNKQAGMAAASKAKVILDQLVRQLPDSIAIHVAEFILPTKQISRVLSSLRLNIPRSVISVDERTAIIGATLYNKCKEKTLHCDRNHLNCNYPFIGEIEETEGSEEVSHLLFYFDQSTEIETVSQIKLEKIPYSIDGID